MSCPAARRSATRRPTRTNAASSGARLVSWLPIWSAMPRIFSPGRPASRAKISGATSMPTPNLFSALPVEILAWVPASTSGLTRSTACGRFLGQRDFGECDTLWLMFDVELADTAVEPLRQFGAGLADAGKDDVLGRHARGQRAFQFAARNDVSAIALPQIGRAHV